MTTYIPRVNKEDTMKFQIDTGTLKMNAMLVTNTFMKINAISINPKSILFSFIFTTNFHITILSKKYFISTKKFGNDNDSH